MNVGMLGGIATTEALRAAPRGAVMVPTLRGDSATRKRAEEVGAAAFVAKHRKDEILLTAIRGVALTKGMRRLRERAQASGEEHSVPCVTVEVAALVGKKRKERNDEEISPGIPRHVRDNGDRHRVHARSFRPLVGHTGVGTRQRHNGQRRPLLRDAVRGLRGGSSLVRQRHGAQCLTVHFLAVTFFAGGLARLASMAAVGLPNSFFVAMTALELLLPFLMVFMQVRVSSVAKARLEYRVDRKRGEHGFRNVEAAPRRDDSRG
jgi:hypothetical protein